VLNLAQRADGTDARWRTLHGALLYQERLAVAAVAARELATRLTSLGYVLVPRADGNGFEVGGVSQEVMDAFSSRRAQITPEVRRMAQEYRQRYGREPSQRTLWAMAQDATLASRKAKQHGRPDRSGQPQRSAGEELDAWEERTTEREVAALSAVHAAVRAFAAPEGLERPGVLSAQQRGSVIRRAVDGAQRSAAAFTRAALLWEVHRAMPAMAAGVDQAAVAEELTAEAVSSGAVLALGPAPDVVDVSALGLRASDGRSVYTPPGAERYTTRPTWTWRSIWSAKRPARSPSWSPRPRRRWRWACRTWIRPRPRWRPGCWPRGRPCRSWWPRRAPGRRTPWPRSPGPGRSGPVAGRWV
jgi:hypothetical protein